MSVEASAKNMQRIVLARDHHDLTCAYGGKASAIRMSWFDLDRLGWDAGDEIAGLTIQGDNRVQPGRFRVTCDAEPSEPEARQAERELVTA